MALARHLDPAFWHLVYEVNVGRRLLRLICHETSSTASGNKGGTLVSARVSERSRSSTLKNASASSSKEQKNSCLTPRSPLIARVVSIKAVKSRGMSSAVTW